MREFIGRRLNVTWMCGACGRVAETREGLKDTSCVIWGVLVYKDSIRRELSAADERVTASAQAVQEQVIG